MGGKGVSKRKIEEDEEVLEPLWVAAKDQERDERTKWRRLSSIQFVYSWSEVGVCVCVCVWLKR